MNLYNAELNRKCVVKNVEIENRSAKIRIMEIGIVPNTFIFIKNKSILKKILLIVFNSNCFTMPKSMAEKIVVEYV